MDRCHLILCVENAATVCVHVSPAGWLLPYVSLDAQRRRAPALQRALDTISPGSEIVHEASTGELSNGKNHRYCLARLHGSSIRAHLTPSLRDSLSPRSAVLPEQHDILGRCVARVTHPEAPFDRMEWIGEVKAWIRDHLETERRSLVGMPIRHRSRRYDAVWECRTDAGRIFFKGGPSRAEEAQTARVLHQLAPEHIPRVIASNEERQWSLFDELPGTLASANAVTSSTFTEVVHTLGKLQRRAVDSRHFAHSSSDRQLDGTNIYRRATGVLRGVHDELSRTLTGWDSAWPMLCALGETMCTRWVAWQIPTTWVPGDLSLSNVLIHDGRVGFIDLEASYVSYPELALWRVWSDVKRSTGVASNFRACQNSFVRAWQDVIPPIVMRRLFDQLPVTARLFRVIVTDDLLQQVAREENKPVSAARYAHAVRPIAEGLLSELQQKHTTFL